MRVLKNGKIYDLEKRGLVFDCSKLDIHSHSISETHAMLTQIVKIAISRLNGAKEIWVNPTAFTILVSASHSVPDFILEPEAGSVGKLFDVLVFLDPELEEDVIVVENVDRCETIHLENISFIHSNIVVMNNPQRNTTINTTKDR